MPDTRKITCVKITARPKSLFDPMPKVMVRLDGGDEWHELFEFYPDEIDFTTAELDGLTVAEAHQLKHKKDVAYLQS